jgi:O-antigen ligase
MRLAILLVLVGTTLTEALTGVVEYKVVVALATFAVGAGSWWKGRSRHSSVPARGWLWGLVALVAFQLVPLPPFLLRLVSPGSYSLYNADLLTQSRAWHPITLSPIATALNLVVVASFSLFYGAIFREFGDSRWRRRLAWVLVGLALVLTVEALYQESSPEPHRILSIWQLEFEDWGVFGLFTNRNHFAGYLALVIPLSLGFTAEAWQAVALGWQHRAVRKWLVLGEASAGRALIYSAVSMVLIVGVLATQSRGGTAAFLLSAAVLPLSFRSRSRALGLVVVLAFAGAIWVDFDGIIRGFQTRGVTTDRVDMWRDTLQLIPLFPFFGTGLGAFGATYLHYQTYWRGSYSIVRAHNDYLQILLDMGPVGLVLAGGALFTALRRIVANASESAFNAGLLAGIVASMAHVVVDFDWQIPAIGLTFIAVVGIALHSGHRRRNRVESAGFGS